MNGIKGVACAIVVLLTLLVSLVFSQEVKLLEQRDIEKLGSEAQELYKKAIESLDKIDPITAIEYMEQAVKLNPQVVELDFLLAHLASDRARITYGDESVKYYNMAENALELVQKQKDVNGEILQRAVRNLEVIRTERQEIPERDTRRYAFGADFLAARARMLLPKTAATPTPTPTGATSVMPGPGFETIPGLGTTPGLGTPSSASGSTGSIPPLPSLPAATPVSTPVAGSAGEVYK